jgi:hypothetical protein
VYQIIDGRKTEVRVKISIKSQSTLKKVYTINLLRTYMAELIDTYKAVEKIQYLKKLDMHININIEL